MNELVFESTVVEMAELVQRVRDAQELLGDGVKRVQPSERASLLASRRSIVACGDMAAGALVRDVDLTWVRPGGGLPPGQEHRVVGRQLRRAVRGGEMIRPADVRPTGRRRP